MLRIQLVGEDRLCCSLGKKLVDEFLGWQHAGEPINTRGFSVLQSSVKRYRDVAKHFPVLCIADVDRGCAARISEDLRGAHPPAGFLLRLAVREAESWVLADIDNFASFLGVSPTHIPSRPDDEHDPKLTVLRLAKRAKVRGLRREMVSESDSNKPGSGYNLHLSSFVEGHWSPSRAAANSPSLARTVNRLMELRGG